MREYNVWQFQIVFKIVSNTKYISNKFEAFPRKYQPESVSKKVSWSMVKNKLHESKEKSASFSVELLSEIYYGERALVWLAMWHDFRLYFSIDSGWLTVNSFMIT